MDSEILLKSGRPGSSNRGRPRDRPSFWQRVRQFLPDRVGQDLFAQWVHAVEHDGSVVLGSRARHDRQDARGTQQVIKLPDRGEFRECVDSGLGGHCCKWLGNHGPVFSLPGGQDGRDHVRHSLVKLVLNLLHRARRCGQEVADDVISIGPLIPVPVQSVYDSAPQPYR